MMLADILLMLSALMGVSLPIVGHDQPVYFDDLQPGLTGYYCSSTVDGGQAVKMWEHLPADNICATGERAAGDIVISSALFTYNIPELTAHILYHEYGHALYGSSEQAAEAYACEMLPRETAVTGVRCSPD